METTNYQIDDNNNNFVQEEELKKWNWGAFTLGWLWGVCNGVYWPIAVVLPLNLLSKLSPWFSVLSLGVCVYLGIKGTSMAWNGKKEWESFEQFKNVQHKWAVWGIVVFCILFVIGFVGALTN